MWINRLIVFCLAVKFITAIDYCDDLKCPQGKKHVACNNRLSKGGFGPACPADAEIIPITKDIAAAIVAVHNRWRNQQALGQTPHYEPAVRMATITYDDELGKLAKLNVRRCEFEHDDCANTEKYSLVGQNIAMQLGYSNTQQGSDVEAISGLVSGWFETEHTNGEFWNWMDIINEFKLPREGDDDMSHQIGHFTQVVRDDAHAIGCAASRYSMQYEGKPWNATLLTCNYSRGNPFIGDKVYVSGPTASACQTGTNPDFTGLCSEMEQYNEDPHDGWIIDVE